MSKIDKESIMTGSKPHPTLIVFSILVDMSNPNGDGDTGEPRQLTDGRGFISDVCIKRKIRNILASQGELAQHIFEQSGIANDRSYIFESLDRGYVNDERKPSEKASEALKLTKDPSSFLGWYFDARMFGVLPLQEDKKDGEGASRSKFHGCAQVAMPTSIAPVACRSDTSSKKFPLRDEGKFLDQGQGDLAPDAIRVVEHGLYYGSITINPQQAKENGVTQEDIEILKLTIPHIFNDYSAKRANVHMVQAISFEEPEKPFMSYNPWHIRDKMHPRIISEEDPTSADDYEIPDASVARTFFNKLKIKDLLGSYETNETEKIGEQPQRVG